jgi:hypothetical protein
VQVKKVETISNSSLRHFRNFSMVERYLGQVSRDSAYFAYCDTHEPLKEEINSLVFHYWAEYAHKAAVTL